MWLFREGIADRAVFKGGGILERGFSFYLQYLKIHDHRISQFSMMFMNFFLQVHPSSNPGLIVLGVTAGYALKLRERIDHSRGAFLNPGSASKFFLTINIILLDRTIKKEENGPIQYCRLQWAVLLCHKCSWNSTSLCTKDYIGTFKRDILTRKFLF